MKVHLLYGDADFDRDAPLPRHAEHLVEDLGLKTLFDAMSRGDEFLFNVAKHTVLSSLTDPGPIVYRQHVLEDCIRHACVVREIYDLAVQVVIEEKQAYRGFAMQRSEIILHRSLAVLQMLVGKLRLLRELAQAHVHEFGSSGFTGLFTMIAAELDDDYFALVEDHLRRLQFGEGVLMSARLGAGNKGIGYTLLRRGHLKKGFRKRLTGKGEPSFTLTIPARDEAGARTLSDLNDRGLNLVANSLAQSVDHILNFFAVLRAEVGFYIGCLNLHETITAKGEPLCYPQAHPADSRIYSTCGIYDIGLALRIEQVTRNDVTADDKSLIMVTGANQGGKSTFLRSAGLAQLMMQCGMFVAAESFAAHVCAGVFTHYRREEDATMTSGKFDEELGRMSRIVDAITPNCLLLSNESFAATNEREGSEIARQVLHALRDSEVAVIFVTHLFDLADSVRREHPETTLFLRAERREDGQRTFRLVEGEPLPTSFGKDLYDQIFDTEEKDVAAR